ncbi:MAG: alpha/beta hydrolase [Chitinophagaceae bacterium]|nr:alpha/beta hydrolase [Chitinophagaceae bacterium]
MLKTIPYDDAVISYRTEGNGHAVVLLHGFGEDSRIWDQQIGFLSPHCRLLAPDLPGSGRSSFWEAGNNAGIDGYAAILHSVLQQENIRRCTMLGHSMGGYIMLAFAEKFPELLDAIGLINSTAFADSEEKKQTRARAIETIGDYGAAAFLKTTIPTLFATEFREKYPEKVAALVAAGSSFEARALQQYYRAMMGRPDRTGILKSNPLPTLFVMGTEDTPAPMNDVLKQTHLPDKSYIHVLQGVGHMSMWEAPDALNNILLDFINQS